MKGGKEPFMRLRLAGVSIWNGVCEDSIWGYENARRIGL